MHHKYGVCDYFRTPEVASVTISPDGSLLAWLAPYGPRKRANICVRDRSTGEQRFVTQVEERDITQYYWKDNRTLLFPMDKGGDENHHLWMVRLEEGSSPVDIFPVEGVKILLVDEMEDDPDHVLLSANARTPEEMDVWKVNLRTLERSIEVLNPGGVISWMTGHDGVILAAVRMDGEDAELLWRESARAEFSVIARTDYSTRIWPLGVLDSPRSLICASNVGRDCTAVVQFDPVQKQEQHVIFQHPEVDVDFGWISRIKRNIVAIQYVDWKVRLQVLDADFARIVDAMDMRFSREQYTPVSSTADEKTWIFHVSSDREPGSYWLVSDQGRHVECLWRSMPWIDTKDMAVTRPIVYTSRDGLVINGYLTVPSGSVFPLPVVVYPHGGPWARDVWGFNPVVQLLASRGYAVFCTNFRGSTGYGRSFWAASFKQWGKAMQDDITDGVEWLIAQGIADRSKVAIFGTSYGGYAALAGLAFTPDLYVCGVDYVGISNLFTFIESVPPYWKPLLEKIYRQVGHPQRDAELLRSASPIFHADKIKVPLLVAQGANDPRVRRQESDQIVEALRSRGIAVEYILKEDEGHGFANEENRIEFYTSLLQFLHTYL